MISWWWLFPAFLFGCIVTFRMFSNLKAHVIHENTKLMEENERLHRRIQLIGERKLDGTFGQGGNR